MNEREKAFFGEIQLFCERGRNLFSNLFDSIEKFATYEEARFSALTPRAASSSGSDEDDKLVITLSDQSTGAIARWDLLAEHQSTGGEYKNDNVMSYAQNPKQEEESMKNICKRSDGRWQGSKVINGERLFVYAKTQKEAAEKLRNLKGRKRREPKRESLYNFALWWLENCKQGSIAESTLKTYQGLISKHLRIDTPVNRITLAELQELIARLPATRIRKEVLNLIRPIMRKAFELDYIKKDYALFLEAGKIEEGSRESLTIEDQRKLVSALLECGDIFSRRTLLYLCTGARPRELATIKREELRPGYLKLNGTKNKWSVRWVKISEKISQLVSSESKEFFIFDGKRYREHLQSFAKMAGIRSKIDVYTLRHTFATNLYILRVPEIDRQVYLGHRPGSKITNEVYTTYSPDIVSENIYDIYGEYLPKF